MTSAHILYIPTIFLLGFLAGLLLGKGSPASAGASGDLKTSAITGRMLLGSFAIFALVFVGTHFFEVPRSSRAVTKALDGLEIFDKKPSYTSDEVYSRIAMFPEKGRLLYMQFTYTIDILFPLTLFTFLILLTRFTTNKFSVSKPWQIGLHVLPVAWISTDFIENAMIFNLLDRYPANIDFIAGTLGYVTIMKFSLLLLSILAPTVIITLHTITKPAKPGS
jgi:hypothetical protein